MKNILIIISSAVIGSILINYLLLVLGFDFNSSIVAGVSGAVIGGWVNSYLKKK